MTSTATPSTTKLPAGLPAWQGTENARNILAERYLLPGETPEGMFWRVAQAVAQAEEPFGDADAVGLSAREFYRLMVSNDFLPNSPTLMNAGTGNGHQLSACFVLPVEDSLKGIFTSVMQQALIHASGGGTGFSFSRLRPSGSIVKTTQGVASGPVSFMKIFDAATEQIKQGGKRRGANMGVLRVDHPNIMEFIHCKLDGGITNFNISVAITDEFMKALETNSPYVLTDPSTGKFGGVLNSRDVWQAICECAWKSGDPGLYFIDRVNASPANPVPSLGLIETTNPCGEQSLLPFESCNLGSINLANFVDELGDDVDWTRLRSVTHVATRFLDDVIDVNPYNEDIPELSEMALANRRIGLGIMGWADMLYKLRIPYDSQRAVELGEQVMTYINDMAHAASQLLAEERGAFPNWPQSIYKAGPQLRNATLTTVAPTGTISIIAGCSSGIEPQFALAFHHKVKRPDGTVRDMGFVNEEFKSVVEAQYADRVWEVREDTERTGSCPTWLDDDIRAVFKIAHEIAPTWHVQMQAAFQKGVDNSISKTIALPNHATVGDISAAYRQAWDLGCMGITVFRYGSKEGVLHLGDDAPGVTVPQAQDRHEAEEGHVTPDVPLYTRVMRQRDDAVSGTTHRVNTPIGKSYVTVNSDPDGPLEVFLTVGKAGSEVYAEGEAIGRLLSLLLRIPSILSPDQRLRLAIGELSGIGGPNPTGFGPHRVKSIPDAVSVALAREYNTAQLDDLVNYAWDTGEPGADHSEVVIVERATGLVADLCTDCGNATLVYEEGCLKCLSCGFSKC